MAVLTCALGPDSAGTLLTEFLQRTRGRLDCAMYEVGASYRWAFGRATERGVTVRLLLDAHSDDGNSATAAAVQRSGGACRVLPARWGRGHWKLAISGDADLAVGTGNLIWRDAPRDVHGRRPPEAPPLGGTREWWAFVSDAPLLAGQARAHFERAWGGSLPPPAEWSARGVPPPRTVGAPEPEVAPLALPVDPARIALDVGGRQIGLRYASLIAGARRRVLVTAPYVHLRASSVLDLITALTNARARGVDVRLLLGATPEPSDAAALRSLALPVAVMDPQRSTVGHAKGLVVDDTVVIASANLSAPGLSSAWEAALSCRHPDAAGYFAAALLRDWEVSSALTGAARLAPVSTTAAQGILEIA